MVKNIIQHYEDCLVKNKGDLTKEVDWDTSEKADARYKVMCELFNKDLESTILDFGCGTGTILQYLNQKFNYSGCDASEKMVLIAKERHPENYFFHLPLEKSLSEDYDYILCNGVFTEKLNYSWDEMYLYLLDTLQNLWTHTRKGLAFNVMDSAKVEWERKDLFFLSYQQASSILSTLNIKNYVFRCDYGLREMTIYCLKENL